MFTVFVFSIPLAFTWTLVTQNMSFGGLFVGWLIGMALSLLLRSESTTVRWQSLPDQFIALVIYLLTLFRDIWLSSLDVTRRVLSPTLMVNPGILAVPTQEDSGSDLIAAFSAHGITITPGELVVDFDVDGQIMYVHCLDIDASVQTAPAAQTKRLALLRSILCQPLPQVTPPTVYAPPSFVEVSE